MKSSYHLIYLLMLTLGCTSVEQEHTSKHEGEAQEHHDEVHLSEQQFNALGIKVDTLHRRVMEGFIETNGQLTLPPKSEAAVTSMVGANVGSIEVIEGNRVEKGQVLASLYHPDLIELQTQYAQQFQQLVFIEKEYHRQEKLFQESVGSGRDFQKIKSEFQSLKASVKGMEASLRLLSISPNSVRSGSIQEQVQLKSPISGYIQGISVRTGQYVGPEEILFEIVNNDHIHAHFKVFESDAQKVKEGQLVRFIVESDPETQHQATIFSVGKVFETDVKAINIHAELDNEDGTLLAGMYARGKVIIDDHQSLVLPKSAIAMDGDRHFIFSATQQEEKDTKEWHFEPIEISLGIENDGWFEVKLHQQIDPDAQFAHNKAYYLISELMKEEAGHEH